MNHDFRLGERVVALRDYRIDGLPIIVKGNCYLVTRVYGTCLEILSDTRRVYHHTSFSHVPAGDTPEYSLLFKKKNKKFFIANE